MKKQTFYKAKCNADFPVEAAKNATGEAYWQLKAGCDSCGIEAGRPLNELHVACGTCNKMCWGMTNGPGGVGLKTVLVSDESILQPVSSASATNSAPVAASAAAPAAAPAAAVAQAALPQIQVAAPPQNAAPLFNVGFTVQPNMLSAPRPAAVQAPEARQAPPASPAPVKPQVKSGNIQELIKSGGLAVPLPGIKAAAQSAAAPIEQPANQSGNRVPATENVEDSTPAVPAAPTAHELPVVPAEAKNSEKRNMQAMLNTIKLPLPGLGIVTKNMATAPPTEACMAEPAIAFESVVPIDDKAAVAVQVPAEAPPQPVAEEAQPVAEEAQPVAEESQPVAEEAQPVIAPPAVEPIPAKSTYTTSEVPAIKVPPKATRLEEFNLLKAVEDSLTEEDKIDVDEVLGQHIQELSGGPSHGGFSWHTLENAMHCWRRAYYSLVAGLVPRKPGRALQWGSLYHACWELWFKTGGRMSWDLPCKVIREAGGPKLAGEVQMAVKKELELFAEEEATTWDIRAVEANAICWIEPERINGKLVCVPLSCRHDLIYAKREPGTACAPLGPVPQGVYILDRKTARAATKDLIYGYAMDGQFLTNAVVFKRSDEEARFGKLLGVQVAAAIKHAVPSAKSFFRPEATIRVEDAAEFYKDELKPYAIELYRRLSDPQIRGDKYAWPKKHSSCSAKFMCPYFDLCSNKEDSLMVDLCYKVNEKRIFNLDSLAPPPKGLMQIDKQPKAVDPKVEAKKKRKAELGDLILVMLSGSCQTLPNLNRANFLTPGHSINGVKAKIAEVLASLWPVQHVWAVATSEGSFKCTIRADGIAWTITEETAASTEQEAEKKAKKPKPNVYRGAISWKQLAAHICKDWWDLAKNPPMQE